MGSDDKNLKQNEYIEVLQIDNKSDSEGKHGKVNEDNKEKDDNSNDIVYKKNSYFKF